MQTKSTIEQTFMAMPRRGLAIVLSIGAVREIFRQDSGKYNGMLTRRTAEIGPGTAFNLAD
jgi:hypothetical protein